MNRDELKRLLSDGYDMETGSDPKNGILAEFDRQAADRDTWKAKAESSELGRDRMTGVACEWQRKYEKAQAEFDRLTAEIASLEGENEALTVELDRAKKVQVLLADDLGWRLFPAQAANDIIAAAEKRVAEGG